MLTTLFQEYTCLLEIMVTLKCVGDDPHADKYSRPLCPCPEDSGSPEGRIIPDVKRELSSQRGGGPEHSGPEGYFLYPLPLQAPTCSQDFWQLYTDHFFKKEGIK